MHVEHLLQLDSLDIALLWGDPALLSRGISGVTATDLEDPTRFLQPGEIVLSGLVWWHPHDSRATIDRFVSALRSADVSALLAGEETHGTVPGALVDACREHRIPLLAVPAHTTFRAITEAVYLRQWGDLSRLPTAHYALPENVRTELSGLLDQGAGLDELLERAIAHLGPLPGYILTSTGRTVARTPGAPAIPARRAADLVAAPGAGTTLRVQTGTTPYDAWHLHLPGSSAAPPRVLHEIADVIAQYRHAHEARRTVRREATEDLIGLITGPEPDAVPGPAALEAIGLSPAGPFRVMVAALGGDDTSGAVPALHEALGHLGPVAFALGRLPHGEALAVVQANTNSTENTNSTDDTDRADSPDVSRLQEIWPLIHACRPEAPLHAGLSLPTHSAADLRSALAQARYALAAARSTAPCTASVTAVEDLSSLPSLLAGVPADVRTAFSARTLGPLARSDSASHTTLRKTLEVFLAHNCSWSRTAQALHLHVNTVHYRIQRIQALTGRDLNRLDHKLDLHAALLCS
ncbi:PucR family transcriptional regulator [Streptomyces sp. NPDC058685]|uniref:PucR family transcriptional regulator n=1 Tax=Streptomyces sp. NPDC058685 TaxID=3346598 RepID=UPI00366874B5